MKTMWFVPVALWLCASFSLVGCKKAEETDDREEIIAVVEGAVSAMINKDLDAWNMHWKQDDQSSTSYTSPMTYHHHMGWNEVSAGARKMMHEENGMPMEFNKENVQVVQDGDMAWVTFTQKDSLPEATDWRDHTRVLRRTPEGWKIIHLGIVERSDYEKLKDMSSSKAKKMAVSGFPTDMPFNHIPHWGGMTVALNTFPAGMDFDPVLKGLPQDRCTSPHWGYLFKGEMELTHADGSKQTLKEGDLYYMPAGHTGKVIREAQLLEFGPDAPMHQVASHVEKFMKGN